MEVLLVTFIFFFISMLILVGIQVMRKGELPTGCTPGGCHSCRKDCPKKAKTHEQPECGKD